MHTRIPRIINIRGEHINITFDNRITVHWFGQYIHSPNSHKELVIPFRLVWLCHNRYRNLYK